MMDTKTPRRRSAEKHKAILDAAAAAVAQDGYAATTIEGVAKAAGVGKQTIYRWWPSKADLFIEVYKTLVQREAIRGSEESAEERLAGLLRRLFALYAATPAGQILAGLVAEATADETARQAIENGLVLDRADLIEAAVQGGVANPEVCNEVVVAMVWRRLATRPGTLKSEFADALANIAIRAGGPL